MGQVMDDLRERLAEAGKKHDGHVTNGSLNEQMKIIDAALELGARAGETARLADNLGGYPERCAHGRSNRDHCESCQEML
jgi:hypothetical protein